MSVWTKLKLTKRFALGAASAILLLVCSVSGVGQQSAKLEKVEFLGLKRLSATQVTDLSGLKPGQDVDQAVLDAASAKLLGSGMFRRLGYKVRITNGRATVIFTVEESAKGLPVVFENFVWFSEEQIFSAIRQDLPFFDGTSPASGPTPEKVAAALQKLLTSKNLPGRVEFLPSVAKDKQELIFSVKDAKIPVCTLHFPGASAIPEADLIKSSQPVLQTNYSKKDITAFADNTLVTSYRRLGYLRAQFQPLTVGLTSSAQCAGGVDVTMPVEEGPRYKWGSSVWDGNEKLTVEDLATALGMNPSEVADGTKIDAGLKNVAKAYGQRGYLSAIIKQSVEYDDASSRVTYRFNITEGPRYFMGNLIVTGLPPPEIERVKEKWTLGGNAVFDESYVDTFKQNGLREFMMDYSRRNPTVRMAVEVDVRPNEPKQTVDVVITFRHAGPR